VRSEKLRLILIYVGIGMVLALASGCATGKFGKADMTMSSITAPDGLVGQDRVSVMKILGDPDFVLAEPGMDYWGYSNQVGWYFYLYYISGGKTEVKDLILEFVGDKVKTAYLIDKGSSFGILSPPASISN
jgi:hypothetical protein